LDLDILARRWRKSRSSVIPLKIFVLDNTTSAEAASLSVISDVQSKIVETFTERNAIGADLELIAMGSGPSDIQKGRFADFCLLGLRVCADPKRIAKITEPITRKAGTLFRTRKTAGSDPIGGIYQVLNRASATRPKGQRLAIELYSDFYQRAEPLDFDTADLSSRRTRSAALDILKGAGLDFHTVRLAKTDLINARVVPGDNSAGSATRTEQIRAFVELFLLRTGASVTVTVFEPGV
jgi:hypothetical protein